MVVVLPKSTYIDGFSFVRITIICPNLKITKNMVATSKNCESNVMMTDLAVSAFSGATLALAFPDYGIWPLAWVSLAPMIWAMRNKSELGSMTLGFVMGIFCFTPTFSWLRNTMTDYAAFPLPLALAVTGLMVVALSAFTAFFGFAFSYIRRASNYDMALVSAPFLWICMEFVRATLPVFSFPWGRIADCQFAALPIIQIADIAGEEGLGFMIILANVTIVKIMDWIANRGLRPARPVPFPGAWVLLTVTLITSSMVYGYHRMETLGDHGGGDNNKVSVALVQGNIDQSRKWDKEYNKTQIDIYRRRTLQAGSKGVDLVVWPETAAPFYFGADPVRDSAIFQLAAEIDAPVIFGAPAYRRTAGGAISYNRAWVVRPDGLAGKYDKVHLVPFGEYVPFKKLLFFLEEMVTAVGDMAPGERINLLDAGDQKIGVQICYEIIFPEYSRQIAEMGATAIVNITNDSWFGRSAASSQSLAMAVFRAVENRIPVLRAAQSGISAIISQTGEITKETGLFIETTAYGGFTPKTGPMTLYTYSGDVFAWICMFGAACFWVMAYRKRNSGPAADT